MPEKTETTYEGSSVTISCDYKTLKDKTYKLLWFKDPVYLNDTFNGTIVYSNTEERPQSPGYSSRVEYITDATSHENQEEYWIKCDLRITDLKKTDSGNYSFRFIGSEKRFMSKALSLKVKGEQGFIEWDSFDAVIKADFFYKVCHHLFILMSIFISFIRGT